MRARGRQAQRSPERRLHRTPPHLLRDVGQLLVRRLFQGRRHRARLGSGDQGVRPRARAHAGHGLLGRRRGGRSVAPYRRLAGREDHPRPDLGQFLGHGRHRPVWAVLGDLLRSRPRASRRSARQCRRGRRPLHRDLEPGVHAVRAGHAGRTHRPAAALDRHRHGARTHHGRAPGPARQLRHRSPAPAHARLRRCHGHRGRRPPNRPATR